MGSCTGKRCHCGNTYTMNPLFHRVLPGEDGLSLIRYLREQSDVAIIILTGKGETVDRIIGLEIGADDYLAKLEGVGTCSNP